MSVISWWLMFGAFVGMTSAWRNACKCVDVLQGFIDDNIKELVEFMGGTNRWGLLLDRTVWVRKYEASDWEEAVVVAVSHKGALAVRRTCDPREKAHWIRKDQVPYRVALERPEED